MQAKTKYTSIGILISIFSVIFLFAPIYGAIMIENRIVGETCIHGEFCQIITYDIEFPERTDSFNLIPQDPFIPIPFDPVFSFPPPIDPDSIPQPPFAPEEPETSIPIEIDTSLDPLIPEDISLPSPPEEPITNTFQTILSNIKPVSTKTKSGGGGGGGGTTPPVITDCTPTQTAIQTITVQCYQGRRTYNNMLLQVQNMNATTTCNLELEITPVGPNPALEDNFTTGNADVFLTLSSIDTLTTPFTELPNPTNLGSWTQWDNNPLQVELVSGTLQSANTFSSISVPPGEARNVGLVVDCSPDTIIGENGVIRVQTNFTD